MYMLGVIDPVAFSLGPLQVRWYGILIGLGFLLGLWIASKEAKRLGVDPDKILDLIIWVIPAAIIGARLYYVAFAWEYMETPLDVIAIWKGGLAIHGGLIGAFIAGYFFVRKHKLPFLLLADIVAPSIILGQAIGRWGNFVNQEAHGGPVSREFLEGLFLPDWIIEQMNIQGFYYHPTFLYESIWSLLGFGLLLLMRRWNPKRGEIFFTYLIWYSLGRFFIEGLRTDSLTFTGPEWLASFFNVLWTPMSFLFEQGAMFSGNIRVAQLVSLSVILFAIGMIIYRRKKGLAKESYSDVSSSTLQA